MRRRSHTLAVLALMLGALHVSTEAVAADSAFEAGLAALRDNDPARAVSAFESLADEGTLDAAISFNRGLAYAMRARTSPQPGDWGRAAHAFEEAKSLTHDARLSDDAEAALSQVRSEIARERSRSGAPAAMQPAPPVLRTLSASLPEDVWAAACLASMLVLCASLGVLAAKSRNVRVGSRLAAALAATLLLGSGLLLASARSTRLTVRTCVVIAKDVFPTDDHHVPMSGESPIPEGTRLDLLETDGDWARVRLAQGTGNVRADAVLPIGK